MNIRQIETTPFLDQKPGTSGLRKKVEVFQQGYYLENFVQSIFNALPDEQKSSLLIGGDGRYLNTEAIQRIIRVALGNGYKRIVIGQHGFASTPAASLIIRKYQLDGGIILSASHNPGGPNGDFGIKFNSRNGGPAAEHLTNRFFEISKQLNHFQILECDPVALDQIATIPVNGAHIEIIDTVADYADLMSELFDFENIKTLFSSGEFSMAFDGMHAITGPYAQEIFLNRLGAPTSSLINCEPLSDFGGGHPDPNLVYAKELVTLLESEDGPDFGAASDGDGDRNMILGRESFVTPSDSLAILTANAQLIPAFHQGLKGVARSMPTSMAVDKVAASLGIDCYETPTGWKFFGNLLDNNQISICGEESFGTGSDHIREKDGLWAVLFWLNLLAVRRLPVKEILIDHWQKFGRHYYSRHDYEAINSDAAQKAFDSFKNKLDELPGTLIQQQKVAAADSFSYRDPVDDSFTENQGLRILFENGSRIVMRLSGTGTEGATLRFYYEAYESADGELDADTQLKLAPLIDIALTLSDLAALTGRHSPDVIT
jgi:phosphoglucomutase